MPIAVRFKWKLVKVQFAFELPEIIRGPLGNIFLRRSQPLEAYRQAITDSPALRFSTFLVARYHDQSCAVNRLF